MRAKLLQSGPTLFDSMDYSLPGSSVHGILNARMVRLGCCALLQGILTQGSNMCFLYLLHWQACSLPLTPLEMPTLVCQILSKFPFYTIGNQGTEGKTYSLCIQVTYMLAFIYYQSTDYLEHLISDGLSLQWLGMGLGFPGRDWVWVGALKALTLNRGEKHYLLPTT